MHPHKIRADLRVNDGWRKLVLVALDNEKPEHLALKLAAYLSFWNEELTVDPSVNHTALTGQDFRPDLLGTDISGAVALWVECGNTSLHKLGKVLRRWPRARFVVFKENEAQALRFRAELDESEAHGGKVEIFYWKGASFKEWIGALGEKTEVFGECGGGAFNLVVGETLFAEDLAKA